MNTPGTISNNKNLLIRNWDNLDDAQKKPLLKIWGVLTYKWQLQILLNMPFLIWWILDSKVDGVHQFDLKLISYLNLPDWAVSMIGFG